MSPGTPPIPRCGQLRPLGPPALLQERELRQQNGAGQSDALRLGHHRLLLAGLVVFEMDPAMRARAAVGGGPAVRPSSCAWGVCGGGQGWIGKGGGGAPPSPSRVPSLRPATVSLTPSARSNGICN